MGKIAVVVDFFLRELFQSFMEVCFFDELEEFEEVPRAMFNVRTFFYLRVLLKLEKLENFFYIIIRMIC